MEIKGIKITPPQPEKREEAVLKIICDLCKISEGQEDYREGVKWKTKEPYAEEITGVFYNSGFVYPSDAWSTNKSFHICPDCWQSKLQPWLESQSAQLTEEEKYI